MRDYVVRLYAPELERRGENAFAVAVVYAGSESDAVNLLRRTHPEYPVVEAGDGVLSNGQAAGQTQPHDHGAGAPLGGHQAAVGSRP